MCHTHGAQRTTFEWVGFSPVHLLPKARFLALDAHSGITLASGATCCQFQRAGVTEACNGFQTLNSGLQLEWQVLYHWAISLPQLSLLNTALLTDGRHGGMRYQREARGTLKRVFFLPSFSAQLQPGSHKPMSAEKCLMAHFIPALQCSDTGGLSLSGLPGNHSHTWSLSRRPGSNHKQGACSYCYSPRF